MPLSEADRIAGLRAILASPANAERLQGIGFVADVLASLHADPATSDVPALLRAGVDAALEALDARARTIVVRVILRAKRIAPSRPTLVSANAISIASGGARSWSWRSNC